MNSTPNNLNNLFLPTLMNRLQLHPTPSPSATHSLEDLLLDALTNLSDYPSDDDDDGDISAESSSLAKEESKLEKEIIKVILSGDTESLKPNSGQAVSIRENHICIAFHEEEGSDYRVWEWHGHVMVFDEEDGYSPEYVYGNYFERLNKGRNVGGGVRKKKEEVEKEVEKEEEDEVEERLGNLGLRELIDDVGEMGDRVKRVLHRNINAGSPRLT